MTKAVKTVANGRPHYEAVFFDVDGTLLWVDLDVEGYVRDLEPYVKGDPLTVEKARGAVWESMRRHIAQNIRYRTVESLAGFKQENAEITARALGIEAPSEVLTEIAARRISFNPYPESGRVLEELRAMGLPLYVVSNWDVELESVLGGLGWLGYFEGVVASAVVGVEKPEPEIFEAALSMSGSEPERVVHVGNDPETDVRGAASCGIDAVFVDRKGMHVPEADISIPDLIGLPGLVGR